MDLYIFDSYICRHNAKEHHSGKKEKKYCERTEKFGASHLPLKSDTI